MPRSDRKIAIVGLGLIGGSFFKAIREKGLAVTGIDKNDPVEVGDADLLIIALHPGLAIEWLKTYNKKIKPGAVVLDVCGVKSALCKAVSELEKDWTFLPGHPMAGKEVSGFENSSAALFEGASMILTPQTKEENEAAESLRHVFLVQDVRDLRQASGLVVDPDRQNVGDVDDEAGFLKQSLGRFRIFDDKSKDAELGGVGQRQCVDVHSGFAQRVADAVDVSGLVLQKEGKLFYGFHEPSPLVRKISF